MFWLGGFGMEATKPVCHRGFLLASWVFGHTGWVGNWGLNLMPDLVLGCAWFLSPPWAVLLPFFLITIGQHRLEGAMNVHVYTQPG